MDNNMFNEPQNNDSFTQAGEPAEQRCPYCGTVLVGGVCPACGNSARKPRTAGKVILATCLVLLVGAIAGFFSLYSIGERMATETGGGVSSILPDSPTPQVESGVPAPESDPLDTGESDPGFYWKDWEPYLYSYLDNPDEVYGTIYDARVSGLDYGVKDFNFRYSGHQALKGGARGNRATPSDTGVAVNYDAHYVQLTGDNPYTEEINEAIRYWALDGASYMIEPSDGLQDYMLENEGYFFTSTTDCFVTYMSEKFLSVAISEVDNVGDEMYFYMYTLNFDMQTGEMIELYDILTPDDAFMETFDRLGEEQFPDSKGFQLYSSSERRTLLDGSQYDPILILQPDGVQIGYNFNLSDKNVDDNGWLTVEYTQEQIPEAIRARCYS